jgi:hypothetical protein
MISDLFRKLLISANPPCFHFNQPHHPFYSLESDLEPIPDLFLFFSVLFDTINFNKPNSRWLNFPRRPRLVATPILHETGFLTLSFQSI